MIHKSLIWSAVRWAKRRSRLSIAKAIAAWHPFSTEAVYRLLVELQDDIAKVRHCLEWGERHGRDPWERAGSFNFGAFEPEPWEPTVAWERIRLQARLHEAVFAAVEGTS
jgi:hypothetical protein